MRARARFCASSAAAAVPTRASASGCRRQAERSSAYPRLCFGLPTRASASGCLPFGYGRQAARHTRRVGTISAAPRARFCASSAAAAGPILRAQQQQKKRRSAQQKRAQQQKRARPLSAH